MKNVPNFHTIDTGRDSPRKTLPNIVRAQGQPAVALGVSVILKSAYFGNVAAGEFAEIFYARYQHRHDPGRALQ